MKREAKWELTGMTVLVGIVILYRSKLPQRIEAGEAVLAMTALLLTQGLVRDLARWRAARTRTSNGESSLRVTCVCAESTLGVGGILAGTLLLFCMSPSVLHVSAATWPLATALVMGFGFATRDLVFDWRTRRLRWEPNHGGTVVWRR